MRIRERSVDLAKRVYRAALTARPISLRAPKRSRGRALLYYVAGGFRRRDKKKMPSHTHTWESYQMAQVLLELGFDVDVMSAWNRHWVPSHSYDLLISARWNVERLAPLMGPSCIRIFHAETADITFQNAVELERLLDIQQRRGRTLQPRRFEIPSRDAEFSHHITHLGNDFTRDTFAYARKPMHRIHPTALTEFDWDSDKDFEAAKTRFLWLGSWGLVLKGLDLVLEAFAATPDLELYVCGPVGNEADFFSAYQTELEDCPNIHLVDWVDVRGEQFRELRRRCIGQVNFSASEGGGGAVITGLHAGLIPIVNYETSVDVRPEYGVLTKDSRIETIQAAVQSVASKDSRILREMSRYAWEFAKESHSRHRFTEDFRRVVKEASGMTHK